MMGAGQLALNGIGVFSALDRAAGKGRNPQTGASGKIRAREGMKFRSAKPFKEMLG
jgi:nucleoid DNA-binding protein